MKFLVLGAGMQGRACAFDLLRNPATESVLLADSSLKNLEFCRKYLKSPRLETTRVEAENTTRIRELARGRDVLVSAVPYFFNLELAQLAIAARVHFIDLGGNTSITRKELALGAQAARAGVTLLPDVGLGPGMTSTLAVHAMGMLDTVEEVFIRDGGLPQNPRPPMNYLLTFSEHGLINEYVENATALRRGRRVEVAGLSEVEAITLPAPLGLCEAAHAAGGLSTLAWTYEGKVRTMDCKLIRYPGHCAVITAMNAMGFFRQDKIALNGTKIAPRDLSAKLFREHFDRPGEKDLVVIRVTARGTKDGRPAEARCDMMDFYDEKNKMTAMMRTTGFPASIVAQMLASKALVRPGAFPVETGIPTDLFLREAALRGFKPSWRLERLPRPARASSLSPAPTH